MAWMGTPQSPENPESAGKDRSGLRGAWHWLLLLFFITVHTSFCEQRVDMCCKEKIRNSDVNIHFRKTFRIEYIVYSLYELDR